MIVALSTLAMVSVVAAIGWSLRTLSRGEPRADAPTDAPALPVSRADADRALDAARVYLNRDEPGAAEAILNALIEKSPRDQEARVLLAETCLMLDRPDDAYHQYVEALHIGPAHAELEFAAGTVANTIGYPNVAEEHYFKAQNADPSNPKHPLYLAMVQRKLGRIDEAKASLLRVVKLDPSIAIAWGVLADIALEENNLSLARTHVARARAAEPSVLKWRILEARILRRDNDPESAARLLRSVGDDAIALDTELMDELATCYGMLGRPDDAAALYMAATVRRPRDAEPSLKAAQWLERAGRIDEAEVFARSAAALGSNDAEAFVERLRAAHEH